MLKRKQYFALILLMRLSAIFTNDFYAKFHQTDYKIEFQRLELVDYNRSFFSDFQTKTFKYNRTFAVANMTFTPKVTMESELEGAVQAYKFLSNEYRRLHGTNFQMNYCKAIKKNIVGLQNLLKCGNFNGCPLVKNVTYRVCNWYLDETRFPPFIPNGEYKLLLDGLYKNEKVVSFGFYFKIYRPIARFKKTV